jgi:DNA repair protein RadC
MDPLDPVDDLAHAQDLDLVARLLSCGREQAATLLEVCGDLRSLAVCEAEELAAVRGIGQQRAARLKVALELGRRSLRTGKVERLPIADAKQAWRHLAPGFSGVEVEELHALYLDRRHRPLALRRLTRGSDRYTVVDPCQIYRPAVGMGAAAVILAHNHPSGNAEPSAQDLEVTRRVATAGHLLGVPLLDHLVITHNGFVSIATVRGMSTVVGLRGWSGFTGP